MEPRPKKQTAKLQARPYAKGAFEHAVENFCVPDWEEKLEVLAEVVKHPDIDNILRNPVLTTQDLKKIMNAVCDKLEMDDEQRNFVHMLIDNKRLSLAPWIFEGFVEERKKAEGIEDVIVYSAFPLTSKQADLLTDTLRDKFNIKSTPDFRIDKELIGGIKIVIGDKVIDQSTRGYLERLKNHLKKPPPPPAA